MIGRRTSARDVARRFGDDDGASSAGSWTPGSLNSLFAWYRSDTGITLDPTNVSAWLDVNGSHPTAQGTAGSRPTYSASDAILNGHPSVGVDSRSLSSTEAASVWSFLHRTDQSGGCVVMCGYFTAARAGSSYVAGSLPAGSHCAYMSVYPGQSWYEYVRGAGSTGLVPITAIGATDNVPWWFVGGVSGANSLIGGSGNSRTTGSASGTSTTDASNPLRIGTSGACKLVIAELLITTSLVSATDYANLRDYFSTTYGATP